MPIRLFQLLVVALPLLPLLPSVPLSAQSYNDSMLSSLGLEEAWQAQIQMDVGVSQVAGVQFHVLGGDSYEALQQQLNRTYLLTYGPEDAKQHVRIREHDIADDGQVLGRAEAERLAEKRKIQLEARGLEVTQTIIETPPMLMYVQSDRGALQALDAETGRTYWSVHVGQSRRASMVGPASNDDYVAAVSGSSLYLMERATGAPLWDRELIQNPIGQLMMNATHVFVPGSRGRIEAYALPSAEENAEVRPPAVLAAGGMLSASPVETGDVVSWGTDRGHLYVATNDLSEVLYRFETDGSIYCQPSFLPPDAMLITSTDGYVYAVATNDGSFRWQFSTGDRVFQSPLVAGDDTYVISDSGVLFCLSSTDGTERWSRPGMQRLLSAGHGHVYGLSQNGNLVAFSNDTGSVVGVVPAGSYTASPTNHVTDRVYLMAESGRVICLRPTGEVEPTFHQPLPTSDEEEDTSRQRQTRDSTDDAGEDAVDDFMDDEVDFFDSDPAPDDGDDAPADDPADENVDDIFDFG